MKIYPLHTGNFKLDGGAMFGIVPKQLWQKTNPADELNLCSWAMRAMLIEDGNRLMLVDTGIGDKQDEKFFSHYFLFGDDSLLGNLKRLGFSPDEVTDVFLTHLHFDHCGGAIAWNERRNGYRTVFKNAVYWSNKEHWEWATQPNAREKASFLTENILPIQESGQLQFIDREGDYSRDAFKGSFEGMNIIFADGHTESQMLPELHYKNKKLVFIADLLPSIGHIPLPYVMGYDTRPLLTLTEKERFLKRAADEELILYLEHDAYHECCTVEHTEKGVRLKETFGFHEFFGE